MPESVTTNAPIEPAALAELVQSAVAAHRADQGPLLGILHVVQESLGFIPAEAIPLLASELNLSRADVYGVITFYRDFRDHRPGQVSVRICRAEACQAVGAEALVAYASKRLAVTLGNTTADGRVQLEQVFCLGNCALGPSVQIDGLVHGRVDDTRFDALLAEAPLRAVSP